MSTQDVLELMARNADEHIDYSECPLPPEELDFSADDGVIEHPEHGVIAYAACVE